MSNFTLELRNNGAPIAASYLPTTFYLTSLTQTMVIGPVSSSKPTVHGYIEIDEVQLSSGAWVRRFPIKAPGNDPTSINRIQDGSEVTILLQGPNRARMVTRSKEDVAAMAELLASIR